MNNNSESIWESTNRDYAALQKIEKDEYPSLKFNMYKESTGFSPFSTSNNRLTEHNHNLLMLSEISVRITNYVSRLQNNFATFIFAESNFQIESYLKPKDLYDLFLKFKSSATPTLAFQPYINLNAEVQQLIVTLEFVKLLHFAKIEDVAEPIFRIAHGKLLKDYPNRPGFSSNLPNWPYILNTLLTLQNIKNHIIKYGNNQLFTSNELESILHKITSLQHYIFNGKQFRECRSDNQLSSAAFKSLDADFTPFLVSSLDAINGGKELLLDFLTFNDYLLLAFRRLVSLLGCKIVAVTGDGNCFFRAVVKAITMPLAGVFAGQSSGIPRDWEDKMSRSLRKKLNSGEEKKYRHAAEILLAGLGASGNTPTGYQWEGFTVGGVNDSVTMARDGVWADHIQVKKLAKQMKRPIWLVCFDDVGISVGEDGEIIPGKNYRIIDSEVENPEVPQTGEIEEALVLHFTPSPGHYEVLEQPGGIRSLGENHDDWKKKWHEMNGREAVEEIAKKGNSVTVWELLVTFWKVEKEIEDIISLDNQLKWNSGGNPGVSGIFGTAGTFGTAASFGAAKSFWGAGFGFGGPGGGGGGTGISMDQILQADIQDRADKIIPVLKKMHCDVLIKLSSSGYLTLAQKLLWREWPVIGELIDPLIGDGATPVFVDGMLEYPGSGPFSLMCVKLYKIVPKKLRNSGTPLPDVGSDIAGFAAVGGKAGETEASLLQLSISSPTSPERWITILRAIVKEESNVLRFKGCVVNATALKGLLSAIVYLEQCCVTKIVNIEMNECTIDDDSWKVLQGMIVPHWFENVVLHKCKGKVRNEKHANLMIIE